MAVMHDFECKEGHQFERMVRAGQKRARCQECGKRAEQVFLSRRTRHLTEPIVLFKNRDGSYEFPGHSGKRTPTGADRIEIRSMADYDRVMKQVNVRHYSEKERERERLHRSHEAALAELRKDMAYRMGQESDPMAKDLMREALARFSSDRPASGFGAIWNEAMEMDGSNREARDGRRK